MHGVDVTHARPVLPHGAEQPAPIAVQLNAADANGHQDGHARPVHDEDQQGHGTEHTHWATTCLAVLCAAAVAISPLLARGGCVRLTRGRAPHTSTSGAPRLSPPRKAVSLHGLCVMRV
ncbi:hypothetical protein [Serinicoccus chungangensis]|uniref:hypothetical protein n=1 Tax=Serinicoccus chungangensis TaxID=767452 RepID=UPI003AF3198A